MKRREANIDYLWRLVNKLNREFFYNRIVINEIETKPLEKRINGLYCPREKKIIIDEQHLRTASKDELEYTIYHEMCHQLIIVHDLRFSILLRNFTKKRNIDKIGIKAWKIKKVVETVVDIMCMLSIVSGCSVIMYKLENGSLTILYIIMSVSLILGGLVLSVWFTDRLDEVLVKILKGS